MVRHFSNNEKMDARIVELIDPLIPSIEAVINTIVNCDEELQLNLIMTYIHTLLNQCDLCYPDMLFVLERVQHTLHRILDRKLPGE